MKHFVQTGPDRTLKCGTEKFIVDFALGIGVTRQPWHSQQSKLFYEKLRGRITENYDKQRGIDRALTSDATSVFTRLAEFITSLEPNYLATKLVSERLLQLEQLPASASEFNEHSQYDKLRAQLAFKLAQTEIRLQPVNLLEYGREHYEYVLSCWNNGNYFPFSPAGRCYAALQELHWGAFGEAILFSDSAQKSLLIEEVRSRFIDKLASDVNASPCTRHYYHAWLSTPSASGVLEYKEALAWLGDACNIDQQPISYSITQSWHGISLGMPRICSAMRLGGALVDEILI